MRRFLGAIAFAATAVALASVGCEALVSKDVPSFSCSPGDPLACPGGQICSPVGVCVASCPETPCGADMTCDPANHFCVPTVNVPEAGQDDTSRPDSPGIDAPIDSPPPVDSPVDSPPTGTLGSSCQTNQNCNAPLFCGSDSVLGDAVQLTGPVCTTPCCKSEDCPQDFVCYGPGTGGTYCVHPANLQRKTAQGAGKGGVTCATAESCRSGVCQGSPLTCADTCCSDADCAAPTYCRRTMIEGHNVFACAAPPAGTTGNDTTCSSGSLDCNSAICVGSGAFGECKPHCCGKASCGAQTPVYATCAYLQTAGAPEYLGLCLHGTENPEGSPGAKDFGAACTPGTGTGSDCKTSFCDPVSLKCTDVCCVDADCAPYAGAKCRPSSNPHYLTCQ